MKFSTIQSSTRVSSKYVRQALLIISFLSPVFADIGCQHIGPATVTRDRLAYNEAVLTSWEQQTLLNIVRVRYDDLVGFVDVGTVAQSHTLTGTTQASLGASLLPWNLIGNTLMPSLMGTRTTTDNPTITYTPLSGAEFTRNLNAPIKPSEIFNLIESGYRADVLLNLTLNSINEIKSVGPDVNLNRPGLTRSNKFRELTEAIESAHGQSKLNFPVQAGTDGAGAKVFMTIVDNDSPTAQGSSIASIRQSLHLKAAANQFEIVAGSHPTNDAEIAVRTRSPIAAMRWLSNYVQVPEAHLSTRLAPPAKVLVTQDDRPLNVHWSIKKPRGVFAAVQYRDYWFWIPDGDRNSKFSLIYLRILLALADTAARPAPPVLTIPT